MNTSLGLWGDNAQTHKRDGYTVFDEILSLRTSSSRSHFHQSLDMQQILETTRAPLATPWDSSFSAVRRFASLSRTVFCGFRNANVDSRRFLVENLDR